MPYKFVIVLAPVFLPNIISWNSSLTSYILVTLILFQVLRDAKVF